MRRLLTAFGLAVVTVALLLGARPAPAAAADVRTGDTVTIGPNERIDGDLYVFANTIRVEGTITGDLVATGSTITVSGRVGGANLAGGEVTVSGTIDRSLRLASGDADVTGNVGGDILAGVGRLEVGANATVGDDILVRGGDVAVNGAVGGDIRGDAGDLIISNTVAGDVRVDVDALTVAQTARISGDLRYAVDDAGDAEILGQVLGQTVRRDPTVAGIGSDRWTFTAGAIARVLFGLITGLLIVLLVPRAAARVADHTWAGLLRTTLTGLVGLVLIPLAAVLLMITVLGIPFALILLAVYVGVLYLSQVVVGLAIGRWILPKGWDRDGRGYNLLAMAIGVILLGILRGLPLPVVGLIVGLVTAIVGLGAFLRALRLRPLPGLAGG